jgi:lipopolysaccharide/colanic/teichoic acid biosynthesis glycosyltransferase
MVFLWRLAAQYSVINGACAQSFKPSMNTAKASSDLSTAIPTATPEGTVPRWKRILDVTCIVLSLPGWLPAMIGIALWIKAVSPGPVFFYQERIGHRGRRFLIRKFRTMKIDAETVSHERHLEQLMQTNRPMTKLDAADPRIIPGGRLLRALGVDELPQLFNVLHGEMSLVGPRPCTLREFEAYEPWQRGRVQALPGLTGYWQVNGKNKTTFTEMIQMDLFYAGAMSLKLDLAILFRTFPALLEQFLETRQAARERARAARSVNSAVPSAN